MAQALVTIESGATWEEVATDRQKHRDASIAAVQPSLPDPPADLPLNVSGIPRQLLSNDEVKITETPPEKLLSLLANRSVSAKSVTTAFLRRAGLAQKLVLHVYIQPFSYSRLIP
jgi:amidase